MFAGIKLGHSDLLAFFNSETKQLILPPRKSISFLFKSRRWTSTRVHDESSGHPFQRENRNQRLELARLRQVTLRHDQTKERKGKQDADEGLDGRSPV